MSGYIAPNNIRSGLVLYYDHANIKSYPGSGTVLTDISGSGYTGTLVNTPTFSSANTGVLDFNGINNYVNLGTLSSLPGLSKVSISVWFYADTLIASYYNIIGQYDGANGWSIEASTTVNRTLIVHCGNGSSLAGINTVMTGAWNHVVMVFDGTQPTDATKLKMYINGVLQMLVFNAALGITVFPNATAVNAAIGNLTGYTRYFDGRISNAQIYNRDLSATEVLQNFNALKGRFGL